MLHSIILLRGTVLTLVATVEFGLVMDCWKMRYSGTLLSGTILTLIVTVRLQLAMNHSAMPHLTTFRSGTRLTLITTVRLSSLWTARPCILKLHFRVAMIVQTTVKKSGAWGRHN